MADLTNGPIKAPLLVDGANPDALATFDYDGARLAVGPAEPDGTVFVVGLEPVTDTMITVHQGGRTGSIHITVTDAPLVVTLGPSVPR